MLAGKVVGSIVATRKNEKLVGNKFMIVEIMDSMRAKEEQLIAVDNIGAGIGEYVLVAQGSAARKGCNMPVHLLMRRLLELLMMEQDWSSESLWK